MLHPSTKRLIDRLIEMTRQGRIAWTEGEQGAALYDTEGYRVALQGKPVEILLTTNDGRELERATHEELSAAQSDAGETYSDLAATMFVEASRVARGTEEAISKVLAHLDLDGDGIPDVVVPVGTADATEPSDPSSADDTPETVVEETVAAEETAAEIVEDMVEDIVEDADDLDTETSNMQASIRALADQVNKPEVQTPEVNLTAPVAAAAAFGASQFIQSEPAHAAPEDTAAESETVAADTSATDAEPEHAVETTTSAFEAQPATPAETLPGEPASSTSEEMVDDVVSTPVSATPDTSEETVSAAPTDKPATRSSFSPVLSLSGLAAGVTTAGAQAISAPQKAADAVSDKIKEVGSDLSSTGSHVTETMGDVATSAKDSVSEAAGNAVDTAQNVAGELAAAPEKVGTAVAETSSGLMGGIAGLARKAGDTVEAARDALTSDDESDEPGTSSTKPKFNPWL